MRVRRSLAAIALGSALLTAVAAACSDFEEEPAPETDAGTDTGADGGGADSPTNKSDGSTDADASAAFCSGREASVCSDFGALPIEQGGFNVPTSITGGASAELDNTLFLSPPSSLRVTTPMIAGDAASAAALLGYAGVGLPAGFSASASFFVKELDKTSPSGAGILAIGTVSAFATVVVRGEGKCFLDVVGIGTDGGDSESYECGEIPIGKWTRVKLTISFPNMASVSIDGASNFSAQILDIRGTGDAGAVFGLRSIGPVGKQTVNVDDVLVEP